MEKDKRDNSHLEIDLFGSFFFFFSLKKEKSKLFVYRRLGGGIWLRTKLEWMMGWI